MPAVVELHSADLPTWTAAVAWTTLGLGLACALLIVVDVLRRPQRMAVMAVVWPLTALFGSLLWTAAYLRWGRGARRGHDQHRREPPMAVAVVIGTSHCGAGCALGDLVAEWLIVALPAVAVAGGYRWIFADRLYAGWVLDFALAFGIGIAFQYFAIAPMRHLSRREGLRAAVTADALSITAWQVGMYGTMALAQLAVVPALAGGRLAVASPQFWAVMQVAMVVGFVTAYPVNWWLIRAGVKERM
ncbi:MAG: hypothetical protein BGO37_11705 [Cellulomonas sp. 73-92]|uniref:DUF4396 domain-containing protein n=1 Tax=Cellulomonas sp. 73-92 TaxID=1895740 RepID=UPI00092B8794|nr:DUF4396 domain-containing protein [Cellulomonas sp. 73-92]OJV76685.1 MAG: hypothetical protein BGO37_11705 [Cellulomonas sp. 73-92]